MIKQPPPQHNTNPAIKNLVIADMQNRAEHGKKLYGDYLRANNGRNNLQDLYEELLDAAVYVRAEIEEKYTDPDECWM